MIVWPCTHWTDNKREIIESPKYSNEFIYAPGVGNQDLFVGVFVIFCHLLVGHRHSHRKRIIIIVGGPFFQFLNKHHLFSDQS